MAHEWNGSSEQRSEPSAGRLFQDFPNRFDGTRLAEVGTLLLFNHANGVDERGTENRCGCRSSKSRVFTFAKEERETQTVDENSWMGKAQDGEFKVLTSIIQLNPFYSAKNYDDW